MEPAGSGATWTGSPKGVFAGRKHHKPRQSLNNNTAGMRERSEWSGGSSDIEGKTTRVGASECGQRTSFDRTREAGNRDEVEGVVANILKLYRNGAGGFIGRLCEKYLGFSDNVVVAKAQLAWQALIPA
jgi:hypothetical protein